MNRRPVVVVLVLAGLVAVAVWQARERAWRLPDRWNPWAPLDVAEPPGWLTRYKLGRLAGDLPRCLATLERAAVRFQPVPDRADANGCGWQGAVRVQALEGVRLGAPLVLSCETAVSLALWERHVVQPAAATQFGQSVTGLEHWGSFACRNVYGRSEGGRSRHATAEAVDVAALRLADGRRISVLRDWGRPDPAGALLEQVNDGACRVFDGVLGPRYNAAHRDHLHLDRGPYRICR